MHGHEILDLIGRDRIVVLGEPSQSPNTVHQFLATLRFGYQLVLLPSAEATIPKEGSLVVTRA
jgi:hypothetical protein